MIYKIEDKTINLLGLFAIGELYQFDYHKYHLQFGVFRDPKLLLCSYRQSRKERYK